MKIYILDFGRSRLDKTHSIYAKKRVLKIKKNLGDAMTLLSPKPPGINKKTNLHFIGNSMRINLTQFNKIFNK